jgi:DNA-directed RNA polymerase subunit RPC12/RpoP
VNPTSPIPFDRRSHSDAPHCLPLVAASVRCALLGHKVHHTRIAKNSETICKRCGAAILGSGQTLSRVAHTLSCFFGWHHYIPVGRRADHNEYVCERCGHPLLFKSAFDPYSRHNQFKKKVSYLCGLFGHRVHVVETGSRTTEYACRCGHSFIKEPRGLTVIRHPPACVMLGHVITFNQTRSEWVEYVCLRCGHPFSFKLASSAGASSACMNM